MERCGWIKVKNRNYSLQQNYIRKLNTEFQSIARYIPRDFCRKPRDLKEIDRFKATEFRQILLYTGQVVLKDILNEERYIHFLQLSLAMRILLNAEDCAQNNKCAEELIKDFLLRVPVLYDDLMLTYNCHCLSHLARDSMHFGSLETTSAFKFENKLGKIKKLVKKYNNVPSQIYNRLVEQSVHGNHHTYIDSKKSTVQSDGTYNNATIIPSKPFGNINDFLKFEQIIMEDMDKFSLLKADLKRLSTSSSRKYVTKAWQKIITDKVAESFSWRGTDDKKCIRAFTVATAIWQTFAENGGKEEDRVFASKSYFQYAKNRMKLKQQKNNSNTN